MRTCTSLEICFVFTRGVIFIYFLIIIWHCQLDVISNASLVSWLNARILVLDVGSNEQVFTRADTGVV